MENCFTPAQWYVSPHLISSLFSISKLDLNSPVSNLTTSLSFGRVRIVAKKSSCYFRAHIIAAPTRRISLKFDIGDLRKFWWEIPNTVKIGQTFLTLYMKSWLRFYWSVEKFQILLKSAKNIWHFTWSAEYDRGGTVVKVLCYKSEGRCFDSRWCHWNFSLI